MAVVRNTCQSSCIQLPKHVQHPTGLQQTGHDRSGNKRHFKHFQLLRALKKFTRYYTSHEINRASQSTNMLHNSTHISVAADLSGLTHHTGE